MSARDFRPRELVPTFAAFEAHGREPAADALMIDDVDEAADLGGAIDDDATLRGVVAGRVRALDGRLL